ncbi:beta-ketoacyl synthase [Bisporella sp. PMI_857]|nr:beta-ketoacyl synthase [Bisporella sp. PMI_857]
MEHLHIDSNGTKDHDQRTRNSVREFGLGYSITATRLDVVPNETKAGDPEIAFADSASDGNCVIHPLEELGAESHKMIASEQPSMVFQEAKNQGSDDSRLRISDYRSIRFQEQSGRMDEKREQVLAGTWTGADLYSSAEPEDIIIKDMGSLAREYRSISESSGMGSLGQSPLDRWLSETYRPYPEKGHNEDSNGRSTNCFNEPDLAIVGMSARFPGGATDIEALWNLLDRGLEGNALNSTNPDTHVDLSGTSTNMSRTRFGNWSEKPALFDTRFFGLSQRESSQIDSTQRSALETPYEAMENAGMVSDPLGDDQLHRTTWECRLPSSAMRESTPWLSYACHRTVAALAREPDDLTPAKYQECKRFTCDSSLTAQSSGHHQCMLTGISLSICQLACTIVIGNYNRIFKFNLHTSQTHSVLWFCRTRSIWWDKESLLCGSFLPQWLLEPSPTLFVFGILIYGFLCLEHYRLLSYRKYRAYIVAAGLATGSGVSCYLYARGTEINVATAIMPLSLTAALFVGTISNIGCLEIFLYNFSHVHPLIYGKALGTWLKVAAMIDDITKVCRVEGGG